jgi:hypothetical protein
MSMPSVSMDHGLPSRVADLFEQLGRWDAARWRSAIRASRLPLHRERRAVSRLLCETVLAEEASELQRWMVRDHIRTILQCAPRADHPIDVQSMSELVEDGAYALLARPALPLVDLAVLLGPCLPLCIG